MSMPMYQHESRENEKGVSKPRHVCAGVPFENDAQFEKSVGDFVQKRPLLS